MEKMEIDRYFTDSRLNYCRSTKCKYHILKQRGDEFQCFNKEIMIDDNCKCENFKEIEKNAKKENN